MFKKTMLLFLVISFCCFGLFYLVRWGGDLFSRKYYEIVPFESFSSNAMILPVTIGEKTRYFQFDTGASTSISQELASELNLTVIDSAESRDYYNNKKMVNQAVLPELTIGRTSFEKTRVGIIRPIQNFTSYGVKIDGYLGNDVFSKGVVQIDMRNQQLVISNRIESVDVGMHNSVDFRVNKQKIPYLIIDFMGTEEFEEVMFDTGSSNYYYRLEKQTFEKMVKSEQLKGKHIIDTLGPSANGSGVFGKQKEKEIFLVNFDSISFVGKTIYNCPAYTFTSGYSSVVGGPFLQLGVVTIDYRDQKFYFKPYHDQLIDLKPKNGYKKQRRKADQLAIQAISKDSLVETKDFKRKYFFLPKMVNSIGLDSLSSFEMFKFDWSKAIHPKGEEPGFLKKE